MLDCDWPKAETDQFDVLKKLAVRRFISSAETFSMRWLSIHCWS
jgi:hypothetical protein